MIKNNMSPSVREGFKSEFGFDTEAAISRSVAKRMSELLNPSLTEGLI